MREVQTSNAALRPQGLRTSTAGKRKGVSAVAETPSLALWNFACAWLISDRFHCYQVTHPALDLERPTSLHPGASASMTGA